MTQITNGKNQNIQNIKNEYPKEEFIELKGLSPELVGRIAIHPNQGFFDAEIDIILSESGKIYKHVDIIYKQEDEREALNVAIYHLKKYMSSLSR